MRVRNWGASSPAVPGTRHYLKCVRGVSAGAGAGSHRQELSTRRSVLAPGLRGGQQELTTYREQRALTPDWAAQR